MHRFVSIGLALGLSAVLLSPPAMGDEQSAVNWQANLAIAKGIDYLRKTQAEDGSWKSRPALGVTAMVVTAMLDRPDISAEDPTVAKAIRYMLTKVQPDGGVHDGMLQTYTTAVCLSVFSRLSDKPEMKPIIENARQYLCSLQWVDQQTRDGQTVNASHPYYGGVGYGPGSRPDLSNTVMMLEALTDSGMDCNDPVFKRAVAFASRLQAVKGNHDLEGKAEPDGGFVYVQEEGRGRRPQRPDASAENPRQNPQPGARPTEAPTGASAQHLITYGSMTHAGYLTYAYAKLDPGDPRVLAASQWISSHYTLDANPGMAQPEAKAGLYYYYLLFSRSMHAWGKPTIIAQDGTSHAWADELAAKLVASQREDGSWVNQESNRWGEGDPVLVTAYAVIALTQAGR